MNIYKYSFNCSCPVDDSYIYYTLTIKKKKMIMIEDIKKECDSFKKEFHENIADKLFLKFKGKQALTAVHKQVKIKTIRK